MAFRYDAVTIGSATRDALFRSARFQVKKSTNKKDLEEDLVFPLGSKIRVDDVFFGTGGAGTNAAVTFARQAYKTATIIRVGDDLSGEGIIAELKKERIDARFVQKDPRAPTGYSVILEPLSGERVILKYRGANDTLRASHIPFSSIRAQWLYLTSLSGDTGILKGAISLKKKYGTQIAWNPGGLDLSLGLKKLRPFLRFIDVFVVNQEEAAALFRVPYREVKKLFKKCDTVIDGIAVMTRGPKGVMVSDGATVWQVGIFPEKKIIDRTGAGDSFGSGFVSGLMRKKKTKDGEWTDDIISYALRLGSANATSKVEYVGAKTGLLTKRQFERQKRWRHLQFSKKRI